MKKKGCPEKVNREILRKIANRIPILRRKQETSDTMPPVHDKPIMIITKRSMFLDYIEAVKRKNTQDSSMKPKTTTAEKEEMKKVEFLNQNIDKFFEELDMEIFRSEEGWERMEFSKFRSILKNTENRMSKIIETTYHDSFKEKMSPDNCIDNTPVIESVYSFQQSLEIVMKFYSIFINSS